MNNNKLYKLLDWSKINKIIYSECDNPHEILGPHVIGNQVLFQLFYPGAVSAKLRIMNGRVDYPMQMISEEGYFAFLLPIKEMGEYRYVVKDGLNKELLVLDAYRHTPLITEKDTNKFKLNIINYLNIILLYICNLNNKYYVITRAILILKNHRCFVIQCLQNFLLSQF